MEGFNEIESLPTKKRQVCRRELTTAQKTVRFVKDVYKRQVFMPWECNTVEKQRLEFVTQALETNNLSALCREYEITRKTGRKWVDRFKQGQPLTDMSRRPLCSRCV